MPETFTLDTSGIVRIVHEGPAGDWSWPDLSPFAQGYVEALFASLAAEAPLLAKHGVRGGQPLGFSDLAPETLALILRDCEAGYPAFPPPTPQQGGEAFWTRRQLGRLPGFPPLTPYLGDDGRVYLRGAE